MRFDPVRYAQPAPMEQGAHIPAGRILPVMYEEGYPLRAMPQLLARKMCSDNKPCLIPDGSIPGSIAEIDILLVGYVHSEFYGNCTNGGKGFSAVMDIYAYDFDTGEQLAYLGGFTTPPPESFYGKPGDSIYAETPNYNLIPNLLRDYYGTPAEDAPETAAQE